MRKIFVGVDECRPGMKMAETIFNEYGAVIVSEGTILDQHMISKVQKLGIIKVKIEDNKDDILIVNDAELFKAQYNENVDSIKNILHDISNGKSVDIKRINEVSDSISARINENRDVVNCINQIRRVDEYTYAHSINVAMLSMMIGKWLKYDSNTIRMLVRAGLLHDIGKGKVPMEILNKPGALTREEYEEMKKHTIHGYMLTENLPEINEDMRKGILMHHEREDGSGYPFGAKGDQIHSFAKVIAVADIYDAMTSNRIYKLKESPFDAFSLMENSTYGILDTKVVRAFLANMAAYYIGDFVMLSTGELGEIIYINPMRISQPIVRVEKIFIDLSNEKDVRIAELI